MKNGLKIAIVAVALTLLSGEMFAANNQVVAFDKRAVADSLTAFAGRQATVGKINPANGLSENGLHWVTNHRVQLMTKYNF